MLARFLLYASVLRACLKPTSSWLGLCSAWNTVTLPSGLHSSAPTTGSCVIDCIRVGEQIILFIGIVSTNTLPTCKGDRQ
ncbi:hypothetical protein DPMN_051716 [Dreissena polymorpha]|uniref:Secreted protein n=1 Tax=Dreissena polymorpha TaxID=45954 RepID=A0A9D4CJN0_DREPO|nr:hypothetical protein DPMN_051716 [Dreissena polymorpha]